MTNGKIRFGGIKLKSVAFEKSSNLLIFVVLIILAIASFIFLYGIASLFRYAIVVTLFLLLLVLLYYFLSREKREKSTKFKLSKVAYPLLSGGIDSAVATLWATREYKKVKELV